MLKSIASILISLFLTYQASNHLFVDGFTTHTINNPKTTSHHSTTSSEEKEPTNNEPSNQKSNKVALIFLHGLGDSPEGWSKLSSALPNLRPSLSRLSFTYVFPPAHMVGITVNGGEQMPGWFDVYDWPIGIDAKDDPKGLALSVKRVEQIVDQLKEEEGIDPSRIVLGGFSQGGAVALMSAYNRRKKDAIPFAGCVVLSGWLPMKDYLNVSQEAAASTPLFWAHGQYDDKILFEQQILGVKKLKAAGVDVTAVDYPVGHESANFEEIEAMADFVDRVLSTAGVQENDGVKWANDGGGDGGEIVVTKEDELNAVLYYLCALGGEPYSTNTAVQSR